MIFNRYWISGRGGQGWGQWKYFEGDFKGDKEDAWYEILHSRETWAIHGEYSFDIELDVVPDRKYVNSLIVAQARTIIRAQEYQAALIEYEKGL